MVSKLSQLACRYALKRFVVNAFRRVRKVINTPKGINYEPLKSVSTCIIVLLLFCALTSKNIIADEEKTVKKENVSVIAAFILIKDYLPPGTRMTSGFRDRDDQLRIIRHYAESQGISVPNNMSIDKPDTWRPVLQQLRNRGYIIAEPGKTPHGSAELIVFDLSGAGLGSIAKGVRTAESRGVVTVHRTINESVNNAVHVELEITQKGVYALGLDSKLPSSISSDNSKKDGGGADTIQMAELERTQDLQLLNEAHNKAKDNPAKQIDIDNIILQRMSPSDIAGRKRIEDEINEHKKQLDDLAQNDRKRIALDRVHSADREGNLDLALVAARDFTRDFPGEPEAKYITAQYETPLLVNKALDLFLKGDCEECKEAKEYTTNALKVSPSDSAAIRLDRELDRIIASCKSRFMTRIVLIVLFLCGLGVAIYYIARPGKWTVVTMTRPGMEEQFELKPGANIVGSLGPPQGEADIQISSKSRKISNSHCKIVVDGRKAFIKDISANGTIVNGKALNHSEYIRLKKNDEIQLAHEATLIIRKN